jgi:5'-deoxynucleotidase YfbR-like HD superfamily hydrolase
MDDRPRGAFVFEMLSRSRVDLLAPDWRDVSLEDMAHGLVRVRRFVGQSRVPFNDAAHSLHVADLAPRNLRLAALLHDGHEYVINDVITPFVRALDTLTPGAAAATDYIKRGLDQAIARRVIDAYAATTIARGAAIEAEILVEEMRSAEVRRADHLAFEIENDLRFRAAPLANDYFDMTEAFAATQWLEALRAATVARFVEQGGGRC